MVTQWNLHSSVFMEYTFSGIQFVYVHWSALPACVFDMQTEEFLTEMHPIKPVK